jgi:hypothetical protein
MVMEELHRIHKDVPFGYWIDYVVPAYRWMSRKWLQRRDARALASELSRLSSR